MDGSIERLIQGLEARFDALLARDEEEAVDDLASSLSRGRALQERLLAESRALSVLFPDGSRSSVSEVGEDYVGCGSPLNCIAPIRTSVVIVEDGARPEATGLAICQALRPWAERRRRVLVTLAEGTTTYAGSLALVASDHILLDTSAGTVSVIPLERMGSIRLSPEG